MTVPEIGITLPGVGNAGELRGGDLAAMARHVEQHGLDALSAADLILGDGTPAMESTVAVSAAATATEHVTVGFGVLVSARWASPPPMPLSIWSGIQLEVASGKARVMRCRAAVDWAFATAAAIASMPARSRQPEDVNARSSLSFVRSFTAGRESDHVGSTATSRALNDPTSSTAVRCNAVGSMMFTSLRRRVELLLRRTPGGGGHEFFAVARQIRTSVLRPQMGYRAAQRWICRFVRVPLP